MENTNTALSVYNFEASDCAKLLKQFADHRPRRCAVVRRKGCLQCAGDQTAGTRDRTS